MSKLSETLKFLMEERNLNTLSFSKILSTDNSVIGRFLRGERLPSLDMLVKIADYFCVTTDYLVGKSEQSPENLSFRTPPPFAQRFQFLLTHFGKTKYNLEKTLKISPSVVKNWANGKHVPSTHSALQLADYFDCTLDFIIGREN